MPAPKRVTTDEIQKYRERKKQASSRGKRMRLNHAIGHDNLALAQKFRHNWEPRIEFRECKGHIIDFIRKHDVIICVQNYLYDKEILLELSYKNKVTCIIQHQEWMNNKNNDMTKEVDKWLTKAPFEQVKMILENFPNKEQKERRIMHHKFILGTACEDESDSKINLANYKNVNLLYGTYNVTYAASYNLESTMEFSGKCHPSTIRSFIDEFNNILHFSTGYDYKLWVACERNLDPFTLINLEEDINDGMMGIIQDVKEALELNNPERDEILNKMKNELLKNRDNPLFFKFLKEAVGEIDVRIKDTLDKF
tara:strand:- start:292 stop:1221 length:930 start_codon:yes stop_codon:yes gene_type:complete